MKILAQYTEVYRLTPDGNSKLIAFFLSPDYLERQLAYLLLSLTKHSYWPYKDMEGNVIDPIKEAEKKVKLIRVEPMPAAYFQLGEDYYFGYVREHQEIET